MRWVLRPRATTHCKGIWMRRHKTKEHDSWWFLSPPGLFSVNIWKKNIYHNIIQSVERFIYFWLFSIISGIIKRNSITFDVTENKEDVFFLS